MSPAVIIIPVDMAGARPSWQVRGHPLVLTGLTGDRYCTRTPRFGQIYPQNSWCINVDGVCHTQSSAERHQVAIVDSTTLQIGGHLTPNIENNQKSPGRAREKERHQITTHQSVVR